MRAASIVVLCLLTASGCWSLSPGQATSGVDVDFNLDDDGEVGTDHLRVTICRPDGTRRKHAIHKFSEMQGGEVWSPKGLDVTVRAVPISDSEHKLVATLPDGSTHQFELVRSNEHEIRLPNGEIVGFQATKVVQLTEEQLNAILPEFHKEQRRQR